MSIKIMRIKAGLTQEQLAKLIGSTQTTVSHWECGRSTPIKRFQKRMAIVLKCEIEDLLNEED